MKTVRIWLNHWFSTAYHIINLIKLDTSMDFYVIGTNENFDSVIKLACDEWYKEPSISDDDEYVNYCLSFCKEHKIRLFLPRRKMTAIIRRVTEFEDIGVSVLADYDYNKLMNLSDKDCTYRLFNEFAPEVIPERYVIRNVSEFKDAYEKITAQNDRACLKLAHDEGAVSFRVIDDRMAGYNGLFVQPGMKISYKQAVDALSERESLPNFIVMPYLDGCEVSADCLMTADGNIIIPRFKTGSRIAEIRYDHTIISLCERFFEYTGLKTPCNIQFKYHNGDPYLLEVNTRMSGGIQLSCTGAGVNIPNLAVNQLLGIDKKWMLKRVPSRVAYVETPMELPEDSEVTGFEASL